MKTYYNITTIDGGGSDGYGIKEALDGLLATDRIASICYIEGMREVELSDEGIRQAQDYIDSKASYTAEMVHEARADYEYDKWRDEHEL